MGEEQQDEKVIIRSKEGSSMPDDKLQEPEVEQMVRRIKAMKSSNRLLKYWGIKK